MNKKNIPLDYVNNLVYDLEKAFWDERGRGARFRMSYVGREMYQAQFKPLIVKKDISHILEVINKGLLDNQIVTELAYLKEDQSLRVKIKDCIHTAVEEKMKANGIEPFSCLPANLVVMAIEDILNQQVEIAEIKTENGVCEILLVVFDRPAAIV